MATNEQKTKSANATTPLTNGGAQAVKGAQPTPVSLIADDDSDKELEGSGGDNVQLTTLE